MEGSLEEKVRVLSVGYKTERAARVLAEEKLSRMTELFNRNLNEAKAKVFIGEIPPLEVSE